MIAYYLGACNCQSDLIRNVRIESHIRDLHLNDVHVHKTAEKWSCEDIDTKTSGATNVTPPVSCL